MTESPYRPIACGAHSRLEQLAMHHVRVRLWPENAMALEGRVSDLRTHDGGEFLVLDSAGEVLEIRLDRIARIEDLVGGEVLWRRDSGS